jgi:hypothetical protein
MLIALLAVAALSAAGVAWATPNVNSVVLHTRIFNDCPTSNLTTNDSYPTSIMIQDEMNCDNGFANLHIWRFSEDGVNDAVFNNGDGFHMAADLVISGTGDGESGLQVCPWWTQQIDGRLNVKTTDGEIAAFGGRLPFYSFTASQGLHYVKGDLIHLDITYLPNDLTQLNPATIEYKVTYGGTEYTSGPLAFDEGNGAEGHGTWGMLDDARVGAHVQVLVANPSTLEAEWTNIVFEPVIPSPTRQTTWGGIKAQYR